MGKHVTLTLLGPQMPYLRRTRSDVNANSVVLRVDYGAVRILLTGDAEHETEERLLARHPETLRAQVLKVAHHGSSHSSTDEFLKHFPSDIAVISCGRNNRYKHPKPEALERIKNMGAKIHRTDLEGTIHIRSDGKTFKVTSDGVPFSFLLRRTPVHSLRTAA